ncbi:MAG TPA: rhodanese-like domain-containing protein [Anaerolineae bacterium]
MIFETIKSEGLAHFSYVLGDESAGVCAVIDPRRDVDVYLDLADYYSVQIVYIMETHVHADFVSGSLELAARTGAPICVGAQGKYGFEHQPLADGETVEVGRFKLEVLQTPGHTPEHVCFLFSGGAGASAPWGLFSGDTLFAGEVGRPDLLGEGTEEPLARKLFHSLRQKVLPLGDELILYPAHGEGSPCGASIGERPTSTIGYERQHNETLALEDEDAFVEKILAALSPAPAYYSRMKKINAAGPAVLGAWPHLKPLTAGEFSQATAQADTLVVDTREIVAFGGGHIEDAINVALRSFFPIWVGRMLSPEQRLLLVLADDSQADEALRHLLRVGYENVGGYLRQGMRGWTEAGRPFVPLSQMSVHELKRRIEQNNSELQVLDVRSDEEWQQGHVPGAQHIYVPDLPRNLDKLDRRKPIVTYCGSGYRSSIAASLLQRHGFSQVFNLPGSMDAWQAADYPLEEEKNVS